MKKIKKRCLGSTSKAPKKIIPKKQPKVKSKSDALALVYLLIGNPRLAEIDIAEESRKSRYLLETKNFIPIHSEMF